MVSINFKLLYAIVLIVLIVAAVTLIYAAYDSAFKFPINDITALVGVIFVVIGLLLNAESLKLNQLAIKESNSLEKKKISFTLSQMWHDPHLNKVLLEMTHVVKKIRSECEKENKENKEKSIDDPMTFRIVLEANLEYKKIIFGVFNFYESIAVTLIGDDGNVGSNGSIADVEMIKKTFRATFLDDYHDLKDYFSDLKESKKDAFNNYLKVVSAWGSDN